MQFKQQLESNLIRFIPNNNMTSHFC